MGLSVAIRFPIQNSLERKLRTDLQLILVKQIRIHSYILFLCNKQLHQLKRKGHLLYFTIDLIN